MKKFLIFLAVLGIGLTASAQPNDNKQIRVGVGVFSAPDFVGLFVAGFGSIDTNDDISRGEFIPLFNPNIEMTWKVTDWLSLGGRVAVGYSSAWSTFNKTGDVSRRISFLYPTLNAVANTTYFSRGGWTLGGSWGFGMTYMVTNQYDSDSGTNASSTIAPMFDIYPLCIGYGGPVGLFVEWGWGSRGVVNLGGYFNF